MDKEIKIILTAAYCSLFCVPDCSEAIMRPNFGGIDAALKSHDQKLSE
jgi:hypothetical protein